MSSSADGDPVYNKNVLLDNNIIADILAKFLKWEPWSDVFLIPDFRLEALYARALGFRLGPRITTADMLESLGSLYAVALYHGMHHSVDKLDRRRTSLLLTVMTESLLLVDKMYPLSAVHPAQQMLYMKNTVSGKFFMIDTFDEAVDLVKSVVRDISRQIRSSRDKSVGDGLKGKNKRVFLSDCMRPHSIYLVCVFSICHTALVAISQTAIENYPGLVEAACLALVSAPSVVRRDPLEAADELSSAVVSHLVSKTKEIDRFPKCMELSSRLGFIVLKTLDLEVFKLINMAKSRLNRQLIHPKAAFAQSIVSSFRALMKSASSAKNHQHVVRGMDAKELKTIKDACPSVPLGPICAAGKHIDDDFLSILFAEPGPAGPADPLGDGDPSSALITPQNETAIVNEDNEANPSVKKKRVPKEGSIICPEKRLELEEFNLIHDRMRASYVISRPLRLPAWKTSSAGDFLFRRKKESKLDTELALESMTLNGTSFKASVDRIERIYCDLMDDQDYQDMKHKGKAGRVQTAHKALAPSKDRIVIEDTLHESKYHKIHLPRLLDPAEGLYWVCSSTMEFIEREISAGRIFRPDDGAAIEGGLARSLMESELKEFRTQRLSPAKQSTSWGASPELPSSRQNTPKDINGAPTPRARSSRGKKNMTDLEFRLKLASKEASLERKMEQMSHSHIGNMASKESVTAETPDDAASFDRQFSRSGRRVSSPILLSSLRSPVLYSIGAGQVKSGTMSEAERARMMYFGELVELSVVWRLKKIKIAEDEQEAAMLAAKMAKLARAKKLDPKTYIADLHEYKDAAKKAEEEKKLRLEDTAESIKGMLRTYKAVQVKELKESRKRDVTDSIAIKEKLAKEAKEAKQAAKLAQQKEEERRIMEEEKEIFRIRAIKNRQRAIDQKEEEDRVERERRERVKLKLMADKAEHEEILRRIKEEARMKYLEELQRDRERRVTRAALKQREELYKKQLELKQTKQKATKIVRKGNFMWHNGVFGFYKDARPNDIPYVQYEDDYGTPYYYDPISNATSYDTPGDAPIVHHTVKEREEYDKLHGEGAYDSLMEDRRFKDEVNRNGGYYSKTGVWLPVNGYYNENYEFVSY